jgi:hypothetical protein
MTYYLASTAVLAVMLFFPMSKMIWVLSVRRLERKTARILSEEEIAGQRNRARFIAALVAILFSALFCYNIVGIPANG